MATPIDVLWRRYRRRGLLVDSNLLLTYFIGSFDLELLARFERTRAFAADDFALLGRFIKSFSKRVTTPNVLTEVSNLSSKLPDVIKMAFFATFASQIADYDERFTSSRKLVKSEAFPKFGLTDAGISETGLNEYLVLTDDFRLSNFLQRQGQDVVNFNHLRQISWRL